MKEKISPRKPELGGSIKDLVKLRGLYAQLRTVTDMKINFGPDAVRYTNKQVDAGKDALLNLNMRMREEEKLNPYQLLLAGIPDELSPEDLKGLASMDPRKVRNPRLITYARYYVGQELRATA